jgi:transposase
MNPERKSEIQDLYRAGWSIRAIARKLGCNRKTVRRAIGPRGAPARTASKIEPFLEIIRQKHDLGLFAPRILREIRELGYTGSLTILKDHLRRLGGPKRKSRKVVKRFETAPAIEGQADWSPYRVPIAGRETIVHCFSMVLCYSRYLYIGFYRNERLETLLFAHTEAFARAGGLPARVLYDNQAAVTLGRIGKKPIWNPTFLQFVKYYGFRPKTHRVGHKERSGKVERPFHYIETDFIQGSKFDSWDDLNGRAKVWLETVANVRPHPTAKGRRVDEMYAEEKPLLTALPSIPYGAERREVRKVLSDAYISVDASSYPVPHRLVGHYVAVRVLPHHIEVLDANGEVAVRHAIPDRPTRLPSDGGPPEPPEPRPSRAQIEAAFLAHIPDGADFLDGLRRRMGTLTPIHIRHLQRLIVLYGAVRVQAAVRRATAYRNFNAEAVRRILERAHPDVVPEPPAAAMPGRPEAMGALDDVDSGSPEDYTLDTQPPTEEDDHDAAQA